MKSLRVLPAVLLLALVAACSPTRDIATAPTPAPPDTTEAVALGPLPDDWHLLDEAAGERRGVGAERAYRTLLAEREPRRTVIVAVIDSGIDIEHEDLDDVIWVNEDEVPGNGIDDDGNGYVDDMHGWNFIGGPDGAQVDHDTYELTRLYAHLSQRFADVDRSDLSPQDRQRYAYYREIRQAFVEKRREYEQMAFNLRGAREAVRGAKEIVSGALGVDSLALDTLQLATLRDLQLDAMGGDQARNVLAYMVSNGITERMLDEQIDHVQGALDYGYNPSFDPRSLVGDDYEDTDERIYGNALVEGPDASHGTHVAGIIAAERDNNLGIDGIADAVEIMVLRAVPDGDERDKDVANAIRYAVDNGAHIINMSFGKSYSPEKEVVDAAVRYADERGVLMIHAAGNDGVNIDSTDNFPSRFYYDGGRAEHWIEVGAASHGAGDTFVAPFSNYGREHVDLFAPGVDIYSAVPDDGYRANSGTSMAAPVVTGVAALIWAHYPELTAAQVREALLTSAVPYAERVTRPGSGDAVDFATLSATGGLVNAFEALGAAAAMAGAQ